MILLEPNTSEHWIFLQKIKKFKKVTDCTFTFYLLFLDMCSILAVLLRTTILWAFVWWHSGSSATCHLQTSARPYYWLDGYTDDLYKVVIYRGPINPYIVYLSNAYLLTTKITTLRDRIAGRKSGPWMNICASNFLLNMGDVIPIEHGGYPNNAHIWMEIHLEKGPSFFGMLNFIGADWLDGVCLISTCHPNSNYT